MVIEVFFLCVQELAKLNEEDVISHDKLNEEDVISHAAAGDTVHLSLALGELC